MATYVMSDIHGNYKKYIQAINTLNLQDSDTLYVLGDVVDRGNGSCKILLDMMCRYNVVPLIGNHEFMALSCLSKLVEEITDYSLKGFNQEFLAGLSNWLYNGGESTFQEFKQLSLEDRQAVIEYLSEFQLYAEIIVNSQQYILVHAGLDNFKRRKKLSDYSVDEMIWAETDYDKIYFPDKILVTGHTPVSAILFDSKADSIYIKNNHIAIDCGCGFGGKLGVLCLDTMKEFYF